jgi:PleD family two-component response regulator
LLTFVRSLGFLAPLAVAVSVSAVVALMTHASSDDRVILVGLMIVGAVAGMTTMALVAWSYFGWRLSRLARALEQTLESDAPISLRESGVPAERRLARAFNAASGAFLQFEARASHDRLTGVANRETILGALVAEVERAVRHSKPLSVAFIDIDRFKPINDTYGHN